MINPGPEPTVSDEELLQVIHDHYAPAVGSADIADSVELTQQAVTNRLEQLVDEELLKTMKVGRSRVWWLTADGHERRSAISKE